jgi:hypothetical protein
MLNINKTAKLGRSLISGKQDNQGDHEGVQSNRFGQRKPEQNIPKHGIASGRVPSHGRDERAEQITDTDAGAGNTNCRKARANIFGKESGLSWIHKRFLSETSKR